MGRPVAACTDADGIDLSPGWCMLEDAGFEVTMIESRDPERIATLAADAVTLACRYTTIDASLLSRLPYK